MRIRDRPGLLTTETMDRSWRGRPFGTAVGNAREPPPPQRRRHKNGRNFSLRLVEDVEAVQTQGRRTATSAGGGGNDDSVQPSCFDVSAAVRAVGEAEDGAVLAFAGPLVDYAVRGLQCRNPGGVRFPGRNRALPAGVGPTEWAVKLTLKGLADAGFDHDRMYDTATILGGSKLRAELEAAAAEPYSGLGSSDVEAPFPFRAAVIEQIVKYYSVEEDDDDEDVVLEPDRHDRLQEVDYDDVEKPRRHGGWDRPVVNPWSQVERSLYEENLWSLTSTGLKNFLAKDLLRIRGRKRRRQTEEDDGQGGGGLSGAFEMAQEMLGLWAGAGYSLTRLRVLVAKAAPAKTVLPSRQDVNKDPTPLPSSKEFLSDALSKDLLASHRPVGTSPPPLLNDGDIKYCVRKTLQFLLRGLQAAEGPEKAWWNGQAAGQKRVPPPEGDDEMEIVFNYLPPGLREAEEELERLKATNGGFAKVGRIEGQGSGKGPAPAAKYMVGAVSLEWEVVECRSEVFEVDLHFPMMASDLTVRLVPDRLARRKDLMEANGFVADPDRPGVFYHVAENSLDTTATASSSMSGGSSCLNAHGFQRGMKRVADFLTSRRKATGENANSGLVLLCRSNEEVAMLIRALEASDHEDVLLQSVKGFVVLPRILQDPSLSGPTHFCFPEARASGTDEGEDGKVPGVASGAFFAGLVSAGGGDEKLLTCRTKAQLLWEFAELLLTRLGGGDNNSDRDHLVQTLTGMAYPPFGPKAKEAKASYLATESLYFFERYLAANAKASLSPEVLEMQLPGNPCCDFRSKALQNPVETFAYQVCKALADMGLDSDGLKRDNECKDLVRLMLKLKSQSPFFLRLKKDLMELVANLLHSYFAANS